MTFIAYEFRKLETAEHVVREMSKRSRLRKLLKSLGDYRYHNY